jgi:hypothetical protein
MSVTLPAIARASDGKTLPVAQTGKNGQRQAANNVAVDGKQ